MNVRAIVCALALSATAEAQVPGEVRGRVVDAGDRQPIANARVEVAGRTEVARTRSDGTYTLRGMEPRTYTLRVRAIGHAEAVLDVEIVNGRSALADVELARVAPTLDEVRIAAVREDPGVVVFDRPAIEASASRDLGELLRGMPGVTVTRSGGPGAPARASIRGSSAAQVLVVVDGVPVNSALTGEADLSQISLEHAERVVVRAGSQSSRYGARALAGVIEVDTRRTQPEISATLRGGAWGERDAAATVGVAHTAQTTLSASVTADWRDIAGDFEYDVPAFRGGGTARRTNTQLNARDVAINAGANRATAGVNVRGAMQSLERGMAGTIVQPSATGHQAHDRVSGRLDAWVERGRWRIDAAMDGAREQSAFTDAAPPLGGSYHDTTTAHTVTGSLIARSGSRRFGVAIGTEARRLEIASTNLDTVAPRAQQTVAGWAELSAEHLYGATRATALVNARIDHSSIDGDVVTSPKIALQMTRGRLRIATSAGSGYAPPTLADQFFREGLQVRANPGLRAERTRHDLEARVGVNDVEVVRTRMRFEAAVFRADIDDMILWQPDFRFIWSPSNFDVRRRGWELSATATVASRIELGGMLSDASIAHTGPVLHGQVPYRPKRTAHITAAMPIRGIRAEVGTHYTGARRTVTGSSLNSLDPYTMTDVRLSTHLDRRAWRIGITLSVENVFDQPAAMLVDYPFPGRSWSVLTRISRRRSPVF